MFKINFWGSVYSNYYTIKRAIVNYSSYETPIPLFLAVFLFELRMKHLTRVTQCFSGNRTLQELLPSPYEMTQSFDILAKTFPTKRAIKLYFVDHIRKDKSLKRSFFPTCHPTESFQFPIVLKHMT